MRWYNYLTIASSVIAMCGLALHRRWLLAGTSACLAVYTILDKAIPTAIPAELTIVIPVAGLFLAIAEITGNIRRRNLHARNRAL